MQHKTRKITTWKPGETSGRSKAPVARPDPRLFKELTYRERDSRLDRPNFHTEPDAADPTVYFGREFSLNTKYIVDIEPAPYAPIGVLVTMASGAKHWIDESVDGLTHLCNRR